MNLVLKTQVSLISYTFNYLDNLTRIYLKKKYLKIYIYTTVFS